MKEPLARLTFSELASQLDRAARDQDHAETHLSAGEMFRRLRGLHARSGDRELRGESHEDRAQTTFLRYWAARRKGMEIRTPGAFIRRCAKNVAADAGRSKDPVTRASEASPAIVEESGVFTMAQLEAADRQTELRELLELAPTWVDHYVAAAGARGYQVRAWYWYRVLRLGVSEVAERLDVADCVNGGADVVQQWSSRGARLVVKIAAGDADESRAATLRRFAGLSAAGEFDADCLVGVLDRISA